MYTVKEIERYMYLTGGFPYTGKQQKITVTSYIVNIGVS